MNPRAAAYAFAIAAVLLSASAMSVAKGTDAARDSRPSLAGQWKLDRSRSEDPRKMAENSGRPDHAMRDRRESGRPSGEGGRSGDAKGRPGVEGGHFGRSFSRVPDAFTVVELPTNIELKDSLGAVVRRIVVTEKDEVAPRDSEGVVQLRGSWQDGQMRVETTAGRGGKIQETWELIDDGRALRVATQMAFPGSQSPIEFTRVYTKVDGS